MSCLHVDDCKMKMFPLIERLAAGGLEQALCAKRRQDLKSSCDVKLTGLKRKSDCIESHWIGIISTSKISPAFFIRSMNG